MADYSRAYERSCECAASLFSSHDTSCPESPVYLTMKEARAIGGFSPVYDYTGTGVIRGVKYWFCDRGCGCVVFDIKTHVKNVCVSWDGENG